MRAPSGVVTDTRAGFLRQISGIQVDEGDARSLLPANQRIIGYAFRDATALGHGFIEKVPEMPVPARCESAGSTLCLRGESWSFAITQLPANITPT
jgi:hypothetical protein